MIRRFVIAIVLLGSIVFVGLLPAAVHAQSTIDPFNNCAGASDKSCFDICKSGEPVAASDLCKAKKESDGKNTVFGSDGIMTRAVQIFVYITTIASVVVIMISGIRFVTGGSDAKNVASAKNGIIYALVGLVVAIFAQIIVSFVLKRLS